MNKKLISTVLLACLFLSACGSENNISDNVPDETASVSEEDSTSEAVQTDYEITEECESLDEYRKGEQSHMKKTDYIMDPVRWNTPSLTENGFAFETEFSHASSDYVLMMLKQSVEKIGLGNTSTCLPSVRADEWGYSVLNLRTGSQDGAGRIINNTFLDSKPETRAEALEELKKYILNQYVGNGEHPWFSMNGHHCWQHYAGEFGFDVLASEIGENIHGYQFHIAMTRGAARQYEKPWAIDFSSWHGPGILDYSDTKYWGDYSNENYGHSISLFERSLVSSYMSGADCIVAEAGIMIAFRPERDENGLYKLTPYGETCRKLVELSEIIGNPGTAYTPVAVVLDYYHGMDRQPSGCKAFGKFAYNKGDLMTQSLVDMIWKDTWKVESNQNEKGALSNNSYGDIFDFLLQNADEQLLDTYKAIILSGDISLSEEETDKYISYVKKGGTLVLNTAYLKFFPDYETGSGSQYELTDGNGRVIVYGPDFDVKGLDGIITELADEYVPFEFSDDIQHIIGIDDGCIYLTLINSDGVTKTHHGSTKIYESKEKTITVSYKGDEKITYVKDVYRSKVMKAENSWSVTLEPGEIAVLCICFD